MIIKASDIKIGTQLAESDGFLFDVVEIVKETEKTVTVRLCSDFSSFPAHWRTQKDGTPGVFGYHLITKEGAEKYSNLPVNNYDNFIEFLAL